LNSIAIQYSYQDCCYDEKLTWFLISGTTLVDEIEKATFRDLLRLLVEGGILAASVRPKLESPFITLSFMPLLPFSISEIGSETGGGEPEASAAYTFVFKLNAFQKYFCML
jgi:hypothetical protein